METVRSAGDSIQCMQSVDMQIVRLDAGADAPWKGSLQKPKENDLYRVSSTYANVGGTLHTGLES